MMCRIVGAIFIIVAPFWTAYVVYYDFTHPELWGQDFTHDPRLYLPLTAIVFPPLLLWLWYERRKLARMREKFDERRRAQPVNDGAPHSNAR
jgi:hypothetical protein